MTKAEIRLPVRSRSARLGWKLSNGDRVVFDGDKVCVVSGFTLTRGRQTLVRKGESRLDVHCTLGVPTECTVGEECGPGQMDFHAFANEGWKSGTVEIVVFFYDGLVTAVSLTTPRLASVTLALRPR